MPYLLTETMGIWATSSKGTPDALGKEAGPGLWLLRAELLLL